MRKLGQSARRRSSPARRFANRKLLMAMQKKESTGKEDDAKTKYAKHIKTLKDNPVAIGALRQYFEKKKTLSKEKDVDKKKTATQIDVKARTQFWLEQVAGDAPAAPGPQKSASVEKKKALDPLQAQRKKKRDEERKKKEEEAVKKKEEGDKKKTADEAAKKKAAEDEQVRLSKMGDGDRKKEEQRLREEQAKRDAAAKIVEDKRLEDDAYGSCSKTKLRRKPRLNANARKMKRKQQPKRKRRKP